MADDIGQISYSALHNLAYEKIIKAVRSGRYRPGDTLRTRTLAKALGVSSTPVREALSRLIAQNALDVDPRNRTAIIPLLTRELLEEMYDIRLLLEGHAAELAASRVTAKEVAQLKAMAKKLERIESEQRPRDADYLELSQDFYFAIYSAARQPLLVSLIDSLWLRSSSILSLLHRSPPPDFSLIGVRDGLIEGLEKGDPKLARHWMETLLRMTRDMVLEVLGSETDADGEDKEDKPRRRGARSQTGSV